MRGSAPGVEKVKERLMGSGHVSKPPFPTAVSHHHHRDLKQAQGIALSMPSPFPMRWSLNQEKLNETKGQIKQGENSESSID